MTESESILMQLIGNVIFDKPTSFKELSDETLNTVDELAKRHSLSHFIGAALSKKEIKVSEKVFRHYQNVMFQTAARMGRMSYELQSIYQALEQAKIPFVPLKGAVIKGFYPQDWLRTSCDIDILVSEENVEKAISTINLNGRFTVGERHLKDIPLTAQDIKIELHFGILTFKDNLDAVLKDVWEYALPQDNKYIMSLTPEFFLYHIYAHAANHFIEGGCGIKPLIDIFLLEKKLEYDRDLFEQLLEKAKLTLFRDGLKALSEVWFANASHSNLTLDMEKYILSGGVYGSMKNIMIVRSNNRSSEGYVLNRIFMPYSFLRNQYPILFKHKYLTPVFEVVRWVSFIFKGNYELRKDELKRFNAITAGEKQEVDKMLKNLGLREEKK